MKKLTRRYEEERRKLEKRVARVVAAARRHKVSVRDADGFVVKAQNAVYVRGHGSRTALRAWLDAVRKQRGVRSVTLRTWYDEEGGSHFEGEVVLNATRFVEALVSMPFGAGLMMSAGHMTAKQARQSAHRRLMRHRKARKRR